MLNLTASQRYYAQRAAYHAQRYGIDPALFSALIGSESAWKTYNPSGTGPFGIAQFTGATAKDYGVTRGNPESELDGGARYMRDLLARKNGDWHAATMLYKGASYDADHLRAARLGWARMKEFAPKLRALFDLKELGPKIDADAPNGQPYEFDPRTSTVEEIYQNAAKSEAVDSWLWIMWAIIAVLGIVSLFSIVRGK